MAGTAGLWLAGGGLLMISFAVSAADIWPILAAEVFVGLGTGMSSSAAKIAVMCGVASAQAGFASAMSSTSNKIGASMGSALVNTLAVSSAAAYAAAHSGVAAAAVAAHGYAAAAQFGGTLLLVRV
jgi:hypothetical protein